MNNSLNAMKGKGVLTITTRVVQTLHKLDGKKFVEVEIADTGVGMKDEDKDQLFKPFFSKSSGGTGLGLVIVKKIVEDHRGTISIHSEKEVGTTAYIRLPVNQ